MGTPALAISAALCALAGLAASVACNLSAGAKDACNTDGDCNPGNVCTNGTCGPADAGTTDAAPADAVAIAPDAPPPFCLHAPKPYTLCDDFDEDAEAKSILYGWDNIIDNIDVGITGNGKIAPETAVVVTPPRSVAFSLGSLVVSSDQAVANLMKTLKAPSSLGVQLDFYIETQNFIGANRVELVFVNFNGNAAFQIVVGASGMQAIVATGATGNIQETTYKVAPSTSLPVGMWHSLVLSMVFANADGGAGDFAILLDGNGQVAGPLSAAFAEAGASGVDIGPAAEGPMGAFTVYMDDILVQ